MTIDLSRVREVLKVEVPRLLREHPETRREVMNMALDLFPTADELESLRGELRSFRKETQQRFDTVDRRFDAVDQRLEKVDQRFDAVEQRFDTVEQHLGTLDQRVGSLESEMRTGFQEVRKEIQEALKATERAIDRLGRRWGIRNESVFRQTIAILLEKSYGAKVETLTIQGEQFDVITSDGQHVLLEISSSVGPKIQERLERKCRLYTEATGVTPARVILATASIHSKRAQQLREKGYEVIEPEEEALE